MRFVLVMKVMRDLFSGLVVLTIECIMVMDTNVLVLLHSSLVLYKLMTTLVVANLDFTGKKL
jgi:hypothetical protein